ncbi:MAG: hypothetical protein A2051_03615 [Desulfovibrionales bacterium GWA2_65_9]|nr:MAG: hypothetical protein A2051_03615 [Desulfovibrionales bacterium GWA2_65_9]
MTPKGLDQEEPDPALSALAGHGNQGGEADEAVADIEGLGEFDGTNNVELRPGLHAITPRLSK